MLAKIMTFVLPEHVASTSIHAGQDNNICGIRARVFHEHPRWPTLPKHAISTNMHVGQDLKLSWQDARSYERRWQKTGSDLFTENRWTT